jgi:hypothetical protein
MEISEHSGEEEETLETLQIKVEIPQAPIVVSLNGYEMI